MASKWYYRIEQRHIGPLSSKQLRAAARSGEIMEDTLLWKRGLKKWVRARKVGRLFDAVPVEAESSVAEPYQFQPVPSVDRVGARMLPEYRGAETYACLQCGQATANGEESRCASCLGEFQLS